MPLRLTIFILAGAVLIGSIFVFSNLNANIYDQKATWNLENKEINLIVVNNSESRTKGLGAMESLSENSAMLFVFDEADTYGIWMKDMLFSIDVLWLDQDMKIVHIKKNFEPSSYPMSETPDVASKYVLELQGGFVDKYGIELGDTLTFPQ